MKITGVMILSVTLIHIWLSTQQMILSMVGVLVVLMVYEALGDEKMNIDTLSDKYDQKKYHICYLRLDIGYEFLVYSKPEPPLRI
jgi:hypothetical protein